MGALPASVQRWMTVLVPALAIAICCMVMFPRQAKLHSTERDIASTRVQIKSYITQLNNIRNLPPDPVMASAPMTKEEQSAFLRGLTALCQRTGNHITSVQALAPPAEQPKDDPSVKKQPSADDLPADATAIKSTIVFEGDFHSLIAFLGSLSNTHRLISLTDCKVDCSEHNYPQLQTTVSLTRYVDSGPDATDAPHDPKSAQNPSSRSPG